jgi:hypothetical protein
MYLDAVLKDDGEVLYNSTPDKVREWLAYRKDWDILLGENPRVMCGYNLQAYTVAEYLARP